MRNTLNRIVVTAFLMLMTIFVNAQSYSINAMNGLTSSTSGLNIRSLNNNGEFCGSSAASDGRVKPVMWNTSSTCVDLGLLDNYAGGTGLASGINNSSDIVGYCMVRNGVGTPYAHAFLSQSGTMTDINPTGWLYSYGLDITDNGVVTGSGSITGYGATNFTYKISTGTYTYYTVPTNIAGQYGAINESGEVAIVMATGSYPGITQIWNSVAGTDFNIAESGYLAYPFRINDNGQVCGSRNFTSTNTTTAFVYTPSGVRGTTGWIKDLGMPSGGASYTVARGINSFGHVVGDVNGASTGGNYGFIWYGGSFVNLNSLVPSGSNAVRYAWDINDKQQVLCFSYDSSNVPHPTLLTRN